MNDMHELSAGWYDGRMDRARMPIGPDLAQATFIKHGLTSDC